MGCLKLTYRSETPTLKVVRNTLKESEKPCAGAYRFGFQGQEKDDEVYGSTGTSYTAMFWQYDSRLGRRWNIDPVPQVFISDYAAFGNNPILNVDPNGDYFFGLFGSTRKQRKAAKKFAKEVGGTIYNKHSKNISVSYFREYLLFNKDKKPLIVNEIQAFNKDGSLFKPEIKEDIPNAVEVTDEYLRKPSSNIVEGVGKFIGRSLYGAADGVTVLLTSQPLIQDVFGLPGNFCLDGSSPWPKEKLDKGIDGMLTISGKLLSAKKMNVFENSQSYSKRASGLPESMSKNDKTLDLWKSNGAGTENINATKKANLGLDLIGKGKGAVETIKNETK